MRGKPSGLNAALEEFIYHSDTCSSGGKAIGIVFPTEMNPIYPDLADKLKRTASSFGLMAFVCNVQESLQREALCVSALLKANVSGIIAMPVCDDSHELYAQTGIPSVLLGCRSHIDMLGYVAMDNYKAGHLAAEQLLLRGHKELAFLMYPPHSIACSDRLRGFSDAVREYGGAALRVVNLAGIRLEDSYQAMLQLLHAVNPSTAIAAADDFIAIGAWQALREKKLPVGSEYALIGFGNTPFASLPKHGLTSVGPDAPDWAGIAVPLLLNMQNRQIDELHRILTPHLISRSTF